MLDKLMFSLIMVLDDKLGQFILGAISAYQMLWLSIWTKVVG